MQRLCVQEPKTGCPYYDVDFYRGSGGKKTVRGRMSEVSERHVKKRSQESPETTSACFGQKWPQLEY